MIRQLFFTLLWSLACAAHAAPGAHGPNGEHLDAPTSTGAAAHAQPGIEATTEAFELVGTLAADELSVMIDRYATNEPVLNGTLEVEFNGIQAQGKLHADFGDYSFTDEKLLKALHQPGNHALVFTLVAGNESDLIEGTLNVAADQHADGLGAFWPARWPWVVLLLAVVLAVAAWRVKRRNTHKKN
ncbi:hypothetical protein VSR17_12750 [Cupriavidus taiwanensis]|uniref:hypothetical protein n=1 Tax=Cupriavidus taiwanensis TaxID=164546 RepID=UPI000E10D373|nr:hypothetical protein [Cupriavidus taiwanensis]SOY64692.1 conserved exported hypothetical protein [Cupriavidus taiwanensis]SOY64924.1 conserved exported hypothetical protein [Cupriavidus taiwanensis]SOY94083.1 conserved exported hypothetical protein [Cupriavidus taiwanensis]SOZ27247.1 conserved exported hypothetical protein [Cupriavidus taiwanensis]SOZ69285.1 conserved exported hypothetical protein [Cupriavidus taiwanensis]